MRTMDPLRNRIGSALRALMGKSTARPRNLDGADDESADIDALDPELLGDVVRKARAGDLDEYLRLAEIIEERDPVYGSVIGTRKLAIQALTPVVEPADDSAAAVEQAKIVQRHAIDDPGFRGMTFDLLDGISKGFAAVNMQWNTDEVPWYPARYTRIDPRWIAFGPGPEYEVRRRLDAGYPAHVPYYEHTQDLVRTAPLDDYRWIIHAPKRKSGAPFRSGIALTACYYWMVKTFDVASWASFCETFGYPLRLGKYPPNTTTEDLDVLEAAVMNIGRDLGAVIPQNMQVDIVNGLAPGAPSSHFKDLAEWVDRQIILLVLGQTATTQGTPGQLGNAQEQDQVRRDILSADAKHLEVTIDRWWIRPFVDLNWGSKAGYPKYRLPVPDPEDLKLLYEALGTLIPLGLRVRAADIYPRFRLSTPAKGDEVLEAATAPAPGLNAGGRALRRLLNAPQPAGGDSTEQDIVELLDSRDGWEPITRPLHDAVMRWADAQPSIDVARERLPELLDGIGRDRLIEDLAGDLLRARGLGDAGFSE